MLRLPHELQPRPRIGKIFASLSALHFAAFMAFWIFAVVTMYGGSVLFLNYHVWEHSLGILGFPFGLVTEHFEIKGLGFFLAMILNSLLWGVILTGFVTRLRIVLKRDG